MLHQSQCGCRGYRTQWPWTCRRAEGAASAKVHRDRPGAVAPASPAELRNRPLCTGAWPQLAAHGGFQVGAAVPHPRSFDLDLDTARLSGSQWHPAPLQGWWPQLDYKAVLAAAPFADPLVSARLFRSPLYPRVDQFSMQGMVRVATFATLVRLAYQSRRRPRWRFARRPCRLYARSS